MDPLPQQTDVPLDQFAVVRQDLMLRARLSGSLVVCFNDEILETGGLLHMQAGRPGRASDPELTDNTLSGDLLLMDRCLAALRQAEPRARHWQARLAAHADPRAGGRERLDGIHSFIEACLADAGVRVVSVAVHDLPQWLYFRAALGQLRSEA